MQFSIDIAFVLPILQAKDYAYDIIEETTEIPENLRYYIDYDAIARDMKINGEIIEIDHDLIVTNVYDF